MAQTQGFAPMMVSFGIDYTDCPTTGPACHLRQASEHIARMAITRKVTMAKGALTVERKQLEASIRHITRNIERYGADTMSCGLSHAEHLLRKQSQLNHNLATRAYLDSLR